MCLAQGHKAMMSVTLKPATALSPVKHSTTEGLRSLKVNFVKSKQTNNKSIKNYPACKELISEPKSFNGYITHNQVFTYRALGNVILSEMIGP